MTTQEHKVSKQTREEKLPSFTPNTDLVEKADTFLLQADMPGVCTEDLEVHVEDNILHIKGTARCEEPGEEARAAVREFGDGIYRVSYRLASDIDADAIKARVQNGVLQVTLPKKPERQPRRIEVKVE